MNKESRANCKVISLANQKGGVSKSFSTASIAVGLADQGKKVLVIDNDPQGHASKCLGVKKQQMLSSTIYSIMKKIINGEEIEEKEGIIETAEGVFLLPANVSYAGMELELVSSMSREHIMQEYVDSQREYFDYILIDCPPNLGLLVLNALTASDSVLIPVMTEDLSIDGLQQLIQTIGVVKRRLNTSLNIEGILFTRVDERTKLAREAMQIIRNAYQNKVHIFDTFIPQSVKAAECPASGLSIYKYDPKGKVARAYRSITSEVMCHV